MPWPIAIPTGRTARRPRWTELPAGVRAALVEALGADVVAAHSQGSGFTPGFASVLDLADGRQVFVKAAPPDRDWLHAAYTQEAVALATLPAAVAAPRVRHRLVVPDAGGAWLVLVFDAVAGRPPHRPWPSEEAARVVAAVEELAELLTPAPHIDGLAGVAAELAGVGASWLTRPIDEAWAPHAAEIADLLAARDDLLAGNTLVHFDLRDDNLIVDTDDRIWICDWNFGVRGAIWIDLACILISMYGDGLDAESMLRSSRLVGPADGDGIDCLLAFLTGYFIHAGAQPDNQTSPWLRTHQRWYAEVTGDWLRSRRGWR